MTVMEAENVREQKVNMVTEEKKTYETKSEIQVIINCREEKNGLDYFLPFRTPAVLRDTSDIANTRPLINANMYTTAHRPQHCFTHSLTHSLPAAAMKNMI